MTQQSPGYLLQFVHPPGISPPCRPYFWINTTTACASWVFSHTDCHAPSFRSFPTVQRVTPRMIYWRVYWILVSGTLWCFFSFTVTASKQHSLLTSSSGVCCRESYFTHVISETLLFGCFNQAHSHHSDWNKLLLLLTIWPPRRHNKTHDNTYTPITSPKTHFSLSLQAMFFFFSCGSQDFSIFVWEVQHYDLRNVLSCCPGQWPLMSQALTFILVKCVFEESNWLYFLFCSHWGQSSRFVILQNSV